MLTNHQIIFGVTVVFLAACIILFISLIAYTRPALTKHHYRLSFYAWILTLGVFSLILEGFSLLKAHELPDIANVLMINGLLPLSLKARGDVSKISRMAIHQSKEFEKILRTVKNEKT